MVKHRCFALVRVVFVLVFIGYLMAGCRQIAVPAPDGGEESAPPRATQAGEQAVAAPDTALTQSPSLAAPTPTVTPLPTIDQPIVWYMRGTAPEDLHLVASRLNRLLAERRFQAEVELRVVDWAEYAPQMARNWAENEPWDLVSMTASSYPGWLEKGALLPLTAYPNPETGRAENLLETRLPGLRASLPGEVWKGMREVGGVFAVPNQGAWARPRGFSIRADVTRTLDLEADIEQARTFADLTPLLAKLQAALESGALKAGGVANGENIRRVVGQADLLHPGNAGYDVLWGPFVVRYDDAQGAVVNWRQTAQYLELTGLRQAWQQAGYLADTPLTPEQASEGYQAGQYIVEVGHAVWPGSAAEQRARYGYEWVDKALAPDFLSTTEVLSSLTGVNARIAGDAERVRRVMLLLEWLHTDAEIYNLLAYGIEGKHWQWRDREKQVIALQAGSGYQPDFAEQLGRRALAYAVDGGKMTDWQAVERGNASAPASAALGFRFDPRPVAAEAAAVRGLTMELEDALANGQAGDIKEAAGRLEKALEEAGLGAIRDEVERQFAAWKRR